MDAALAHEVLLAIEQGIERTCAEGGYAAKEVELLGALSDGLPAVGGIEEHRHLAELQQAKGRRAGDAGGSEPFRPVFEHAVHIERKQQPGLTDPIHVEAAAKPVVDDLRTPPFPGKGSIGASLTR